MTVLSRPTRLVRGKELPADLEVRRDSMVEPQEVALFEAGGVLGTCTRPTLSRPTECACLNEYSTST